GHSRTGKTHREAGPRAEGQRESQMIAPLTNHLWQSTLFAGGVWLLSMLLRNNRAGVRYWLWLAASVKFLAPFSMVLPLGAALSGLPAGRAVASAAPPAMSQAVDRLAQPFDERWLAAPQDPQGGVDWLIVELFAGWTAGFTAIAVTRWRAWRRI